MAAAIGLGIYPSFDAIKPIMPVEHVFTPESEHKATYDRFYSAYRQVYPSLKKLYHTLNHVEKKPVNGSKG
jgi:sugar (pentulose or hexulose) kinase